MNLTELTSLRGHPNAITCIEKYYGQEPTLISADANGWIIWWRLNTRRPIGTWKGHDASVITIIQLDNGRLLTHSKDSEIKIWDILNCKDFSSKLPSLDYTDTKLSNDSYDLKALLKEYPLPEYDSIPVNTLNFCNVAYFQNYLITPASQDSNNFDIYSIFESKELNLKRIVTNFDGYSLYKKLVLLENGIEDEVSGTKRNNFGILMRILYVLKDLFFIGYESGHVIGFQLEIMNPLSSTVQGEKMVQRTLINREPKLSIFFHTSAHEPQPILSLYQKNSKIFTGSTKKRLTVDDYLTKNHQEVKLDSMGINAISVVNEFIILGSWSGQIKVLDSQFNEVTSVANALPSLASFESNDGQAEERPRKTSLKLSALITLENVESHPTSAKALVRAKRSITSKKLLILGFEDGLIKVYSM